MIQIRIRATPSPLMTPQPSKVPGISTPGIHSARSTSPERRGPSPITASIMAGPGVLVCPDRSSWLPETAERTHSRANRPRLSLSGGDHGGELGGAGVVTVQARPAVTILFKGRDESDATEWQPLVGKLLEKAPDPRLVLNEIVCRLH